MKKPILFLLTLLMANSVYSAVDADLEVIDVDSYSSSSRWGVVRLSPIFTLYFDRTSTSRTTVQIHAGVPDLDSILIGFGIQSGDTTTDLAKSILITKQGAGDYLVEGKRKEPGYDTFNSSAVAIPVIQSYSSNAVDGYVLIQFVITKADATGDGVDLDDEIDVTFWYDLTTAIDDFSTASGTIEKLDFSEVEWYSGVDEVEDEVGTLQDASGWDMVRLNAYTYLYFLSANVGGSADDGYQFQIHALNVKYGLYQTEFGFGLRDAGGGVDWDIAHIQLVGKTIIMQDMYAADEDRESMDQDTSYDLELLGYQILDGELVVEFQRLKSTGDGTHDKVIAGSNNVFGFGTPVSIYFTNTLGYTDARDLSWADELEDHTDGEVDPIAIGASSGSIIYSADLQVDYEFTNYDGSAYTGSGDPPSVTFLVTIPDTIRDDWVGFGFKGDKALYNAFVIYYDEPAYVLKDMRGTFDEDLEVDSYNPPIIGVLRGSAGNPSYVKFRYAHFSIQNTNSSQPNQITLGLQETFFAHNAYSDNEGELSDTDTTKSQFSIDFQANSKSNLDLAVYGSDGTDYVNYGFFRFGLNFNVYYQYIDGTGAAVTESPTAINIVLECLDACEWFALALKIDSSSWDIHLATVTGEDIAIADSMLASATLDGTETTDPTTDDLTLLGYQVSPNRRVVKYQRDISVATDTEDLDEIPTTGSLSTAIAYDAASATVDLSQNLEGPSNRNWDIENVAQDFTSAIGDVSTSGFRTITITDESVTSYSLTYSYQFFDSDDDPASSASNAEYIEIVLQASFTDIDFVAIAIANDELFEDGYNLFIAEKDGQLGESCRLRSATAQLLSNFGMYSESADQDLTLLGYQYSDDDTMIVKFSRLIEPDSDDSTRTMPGPGVYLTAGFYGKFDSAGSVKIRQSSTTHRIDPVESNWSLEALVEEEEDGGGEEEEEDVEEGEEGGEVAELVYQTFVDGDAITVGYVITEADKATAATEITATSKILVNLRYNPYNANLPFVILALGTQSDSGSEEEEDQSGGAEEEDEDSGRRRLQTIVWRGVTINMESGFMTENYYEIDEESNLILTATEIEDDDQVTMEEADLDIKRFKMSTDIGYWGLKVDGDSVPVIPYVATAIADQATYTAEEQSSNQKFSELTPEIPEEEVEEDSAELLKSSCVGVAAMYLGLYALM